MASPSSSPSSSSPSSSSPSSSSPSSSSPSSSPRSLKAVVLGDGNVGKTCLLISFTTNKFPTDVVPTVFDSYMTEVIFDSSPVTLGLFDTGGQETFDNVRHLAYDRTDVFIVCFSVSSSASFSNVKNKWLPEIRQYSPETPFVIVGTQMDLRHDPDTLARLQKHRLRPVPPDWASSLGKRSGATACLECSALTMEGVAEVFDAAVAASQRRRRGKGGRKKKRGGEEKRERNCLIL